MQTSAQYDRRLADKILSAARMACDDADAEVTAMLLIALEMALSRPSGEGHRSRRRQIEAAARLHKALGQMEQRSGPHSSPGQHADA